jgi:hypothetical protein
VSTEFFRIVRLIKLKDSEAPPDQRRIPSFVKMRNLTAFAAAARPFRPPALPSKKLKRGSVNLHFSTLLWTNKGTPAHYRRRARRWNESDMIVCAQWG